MDADERAIGAPFPAEGMEPTLLLVVSDIATSAAFYRDVLGAEVTIRVPDCRGAYETLRSRGAEFLTPPVDHGRETRCFLRDPDGHLFELSEYRPS